METLGKYTGITWARLKGFNHVASRHSYVTWETQKKIMIFEQESLDEIWKDFFFFGSTKELEVCVSNLLA